MDERQDSDLPLSMEVEFKHLPEFVSRDLLFRLGLNAVEMLNTLPERSYYKKYLIYFFAR